MGQKTNSTILSLSTKNPKWNSKYIPKNNEESSFLLFKNYEAQNYLNQVFKNHSLILKNCQMNYNYNEVRVFISFYEENFRTTKLYKTHLQTINGDKSPNLNASSSSNSYNLVSKLVNKIVVTSLSLYFKNKKIEVVLQNLNKKFENNLKRSKSNAEEYKNTLKHLKRFLKDDVFKNFLKVLFIGVTEKRSSKLLADTIADYFSRHKKRHNYLLFFLKRVLTLLLTLKMSKINGIKLAISGRMNGAPRAKRKILRVGTIPLQSFNSIIDYYESVSYTSNGIQW
jgi:hypothetical protein